MPETYPGFQNDGAFQVAEDAGFATGLVTVEPPAPGGGVGVGVVVHPRPRRGRRWRAPHQVDAVVTLDAPARVSDAISRDDEDVLTLLVAGGRSILVDDEDTLLLVAAGARGRGGSPAGWRTSDHAAWIEEDEP